MLLTIFYGLFKTYTRPRGTRTPWLAKRLTLTVMAGARVQSLTQKKKLYRVKYHKKGCREGCTPHFLLFQYNA